MQNQFDEIEDDNESSMPASIFSLTPPEFEEVVPPTLEELKAEEEEYERRKAQEEAERKEAELKAQQEQQAQEEEERKELEAQMNHGASSNDPFDLVDFKSNSAVKKYIFAVSRDFSDVIDVLDLDARSAFVNDAIELKIEKDAQDEKKERALSMVKHAVVVLLTAIIGTPIVFILLSFSINCTQKSYEYVQRNFEKLYQEKAQKEEIIRSSRKIIRD